MGVPKEPNLDYHDDVGVWTSILDHIESAEMCCAFCQAEPHCGHFTWVQDAGLDGEPGQCWLKAGKPQSKVKRSGVISGVTPPRLAVVPERGARVPGVGSMLCFSLAVPGTTEPGLLTWQLERGMGIFACDESAVYSNVPLKLGSRVVASVVNSDLKCKMAILFAARLLGCSAARLLGCSAARLLGCSAARWAGQSVTLLCVGRPVNWPALPLSAVGMLSRCVSKSIDLPLDFYVKPPIPGGWIYPHLCSLTFAHKATSSVPILGPYWIHFFLGPGCEVGKPCRSRKVPVIFPQGSRKRGRKQQFMNTVQTN